MQMTVVLDNLSPRQHCRQMDVRFKRRHRDAREQWKIVPVTGAAKRLHRPQGVATVEANGVEGIPVGELFQRGWWKMGAQPKVANGIEAFAAHALDLMPPLFREAVDLPQ